MAVVQIQTSQLRASIEPDAGASAVSLEGHLGAGAGWTPLMRPTPAQAVAANNSGSMASFVMAPWSNRIVDAAFDFEGRHYALHANTPQGFAIHGDVRDRQWRVVQQRPESVTCLIDSRDFPDFNFSVPIVAEIRYALDDESFATTLKLTNAGSESIPAGFGFHPYFNRGFGATPVDEAQLQLKVAGVYQPLPGMASRSISTPPAGGARSDSEFFAVPPYMDFASLTPIGSRDIDHCFAGWDGRATIAYPSTGVQLEFECDPVFGHVVVYTPPGRPFFAVEPVTHANDGFNMLAHGSSASGARVLRPGEQLAGTFCIKVKR